MVNKARFMVEHKAIGLIGAIACAVGVGVGAVWAAMPEFTKEVEGFQDRKEAIVLNDFLSFKKENIKDAMVLGRGGTNVLEKSGEVVVKTGKGVARFFSGGWSQ